MSLTFKEFTNTICNNCNHCTIAFLNQQEYSFCYTMYKRDSLKFIKFCFPKLKQLHVWPYTPSKEDKTFRSIFCDSGVCSINDSDGCLGFSKCLNMHLDSILGIKIYDGKEKENEATVLYGGSNEWIQLIKDNW